MRQLLDWDPLIRAKTESEVQGDTVVIRNSMDAEPIIERNKKLLNSGEDGYSKSRCLRRVATIDLVTWLDLKKRGILNDKKKMSAWLNSSENSHFRTAPGRV